MNHRKIFLYIAGALFFMMCGSLWQEYVGASESPSQGRDGSASRRHDVSSSRDNASSESARYYAVPKPAVESFEFDPNEADSSQLLRLGLTPAQVRSIYRHRARGYAYSTPEDFARTPFMTKGQWAHLRPLIRIGDRYKPLAVSPATVSRLVRADSSATVSRPVRAENPDTVLRSSFFTLHLNDDGFKTLLRHPFLSYEQVKAVKNFQRRYGRIRNMTELLILPEFTVDDTVRLSPYLRF